VLELVLLAEVEEVEDWATFVVVEEATLPSFPHRVRMSPTVSEV